MIPFVLCTGMRRSGSTWSYNVVRLIVHAIAGKLNKPFACGYGDCDYAYQKFEANPETFYVVKNHHPSKSSIALIGEGKIGNIYTIRDPRDAVVSILQLGETEGGIDAALQSTEQALTVYRMLEKSGNTLFVEYEALRDSSHHEIQRIAQYLNVSLDDNSISILQQKVSVQKGMALVGSLKTVDSSTVHFQGTNRVDNQTLLHEKHFNDGLSRKWLTELKEEEWRWMNRQLKPWLIDLGYETEDSIRLLV